LLERGRAGFPSLSALVAMALDLDGQRISAQVYRVDKIG
jgi:hypothetical protein